MIARRYRLPDGSFVVDVVEALDLGGAISQWHIGALLRERSSGLRAALRALDAGDELPQCRAATMARVEQYQAFVAEVRPVLAHPANALDVIVIDQTHRMGATIPRRYCSIFGSEAVLTIHEDVPQRWHQYETWLYWYLDGARLSTKRFALYLLPQSYRLIEHSDSTDAHAALAHFNAGRDRFAQNRKIS
jgi:hypothetical protein